MIEFKNYKIIKKIGDGAQGVVNLAEDKRLGRKVAIKSLHNKLITDDTHKARFIGEAKLLSQLNHTKVVTLYDYLANDDGFHLVMEYVEGTALDDYIKNVSGPIQELRAIEIFIQVLEGIKYIHNKNVVHRDIKPSNILLDKNDDIKLLDFGIAKNYESNPNLTVVGKGVGGTPMYMSPEHVSNSEINIKSDIYSLGVVLWHILTGVAPYEGMAVGQIYGKIERDPLKNIQEVYSHVSIRMNDIVKKATQKNPEDRYDSSESFIRALQDLKSQLLSDDKNPTVFVKNIDVKITNVDDALIVINSAGCIGSELTYSGLPGEKVRIIIQKEGFNKYFRQFIINNNKSIKIELVKTSSVNTFMLYLIIVILFIMLIFTLTYDSFLT